MRMIACALPPTSGRLEILGIPVTEHPRRVKSRMGVVPQEDNLDEEITVLDNLLIHARYHGIKPKNACSTALELLEFMELVRAEYVDLLGEAGFRLNRAAARLTQSRSAPVS